jgi:hypothetical protein
MRTSFKFKIISIPKRFKSVASPFLPSSELVHTDLVCGHEKHPSFVFVFGAIPDQMTVTR